jgi:hypothetical protein
LLPGVCSVRGQHLRDHGDGGVGRHDEHRLCVCVCVCVCVRGAE